MKYKYLTPELGIIKEKMDKDCEYWKTVPGNILREISQGWCWEVYEKLSSTNDKELFQIMDFVPKVYNHPNKKL